LRTADCHPSKRHKAKGLCAACYAVRQRSLNSEKYRGYVKKYQRENKEKCKRRAYKWRALNIEKVRQIDRERYSKDTVKRKKSSARSRKLRPDAIKKAQRTWYVLNKDRVIASNHRRKARLRDSDSPGVPTHVFKAKCEESDGRCWYCLAKCDKLQREHVVPISRGGRDEPDNVIPACRTCNSSKKDKLLSEWLFR
jgi:5-methylcytosine-specific restriction endonuclease McrA